MPIYHPSHITELGKILNIICLSCLRLKNGKGTGKKSKFTSCSYCQDLPPLCVAEVKKSNGARSLKLTAPPRAQIGDGFWSFLDQFGFHTKHRAHSRPLLPKEVQNTSCPKGFRTCASDCCKDTEDSDVGVLKKRGTHIIFFCFLGSEHDA